MPILSNSLQVDEQDRWLLDYAWYAYNGYAAFMQDGVVIRLHHCIIGMPIDPTIAIDHINRDRLDNRRDNLRYITWSENLRNSERSDNAKHIYRQGWNGRFYVEITRQRQRFYGGTFDTYDEALGARNELLRSLCTV